MKKYIINHDLVCSNVYTANHPAQSSTMHLLESGSNKCWSETRVPTIPMLIYVFLERIMTDALDGHVGTVSIGGGLLTSLRFLYDIEGLTGSETELRQLVSKLERASNDYGIKISGEKTKLMMNNNNGMTTSIQTAGNTIDEVKDPNT